MIRFSRRQLVDIYLINRLYVDEIHIEAEQKHDLEKRNLELSEYEEQGGDEGEEEFDDSNFYEKFNENPLRQYAKVNAVNMLHTSLGS